MPIVKEGRYFEIEEPVSATMKDRGHASQKIIDVRKKVLEDAKAKCIREGRPFLRNDPALLAAIEKGVYASCWKVEDNNTNHREPAKGVHMLGKGRPLTDRNGKRL